MAQPILAGAAPFLLALFSSDNRFSAQHVNQRFLYVSQELEKFEIEVITYSADGDSRELKFMKHIMQLTHDHTMIGFFMMRA